MISNKKLILTIDDIDSSDDVFYFKKSKTGAFIEINKNKKIYEYFYGCREDFRECLDNKPTIIGFYYKDINIQLINKFFEVIETKLKLKKKSVFINTLIKDIPESDGYMICIEPSPFWMDDIFRRDFLTLFLRCAAVYYKGDFNKALNSYDLTKKIKPAIFHFLEGNVYPNYSPLNYYDDFEYDGFQGLIETFKNKTKEQMRGYLLDFDISKC